MKSDVTYLFSLSLTADRVRDIWCPSCERETLRFDPRTVQRHETLATRRMEDSELGHVDSEDWNCAFVLRCLNVGCNETVFGVGVVSGAEAVRDDGEPVYFERIQPSFFQPPLKFVTVPDEAPRSVSASITQASNLYYSDRSAAANCLRRALEHLVQAQLDRSTHKKEQTLHGRLVRLTENNPVLTDRLTAAKLVGNSGSHAGSRPTRTDVESAFRLLQSAVEHFYGVPAVDLDGRAAQILQRERARRDRQR
ncbi:MAG: hypothetical protein ACI82G_002196 [Bradymonadia bacterium]|jgi:hypothetical protein